MFPQLFAAETVASPSKIMTIGVRQQRPPISAKRLESPNTLFPSRPLSIPPSSITNKDKATKRADGSGQKADGSGQKAGRQKAVGRTQKAESTNAQNAGTQEVLGYQGLNFSGWAIMPPIFPTCS